MNNVQQPSTPLAAKSPFTFGQSSQTTLATNTPQPSSAGANTPFTFGQSNTAQQPASSTPFGFSRSTNATNPIFGQANTAASTQQSSLFGQPQRPQSGIFGSSSAPFGQQGSNPFSFGQSGASTSQAGTGLFGGNAVGGAGQQAIGGFAQHGAQPAKPVSDSSREHVCVHKETLEKLKGIDWTKVNEGTLFHELPEPVKAFLVDVNRKLQAEKASQSLVQQNLADLNAMNATVSGMASDERIASGVNPSEKPSLSENLSHAVESIHTATAATIHEVESLEQKSTNFQMLIHRSLRGLLDSIRLKKDDRSEPRAALENDALLRSVTEETELKLRGILTLFPSLALRWSLFASKRPRTTLRQIVESLRGMMHDVCARFSAYHEGVKCLHERFAKA